MEYTLKRELFFDIFAVPKSIVDEHMALCTGVALKVILTVLRNPSVSVDISALSKVLVLPPDEIKAALDYWVNCGILESTGATISVAPPEPHKPPQIAHVEKVEIHQKQTEKPPKTAIATARIRYTRAEVNEMIDGDSTLTTLVAEMQGCLGKTLTSVDLDALTALYTYYGMSAYFIMMVAQYCASIDKRSLSYIEKTAAQWQSDSVNDDNIAVHIAQMAERSAGEGRLRRLLGITDRRLTSAERAFIISWTETMQMPDELITEAYEKTVERTGKLQFKYMNSILTAWHQKGIKTVQDINEKDDSKARTADTRYDNNSILNLIEEGYRPK